MWVDAEHGYDHARTVRWSIVLIVYVCVKSSGLCVSRDGSRWPGHNNRSAEMLAVVRRGPFAKPTETEQLEYLFTRVPRTDSRKDFEKHSLEHVLSFQRRVLHTKKAFLHRGHRTPLGIVEDYWDRTEVG